MKFIRPPYGGLINFAEIVFCRIFAILVVALLAGKFWVIVLHRRPYSSGFRV